MPSSTVPIRSVDSDIYNVIIIGGGPSVLAVAARLREPLTSALYTDVEHSNGLEGMVLKFARETTVP
ncbi:hypothetical protein PILCRDRAFT_822737 [Piloderma croceum F 1598]|uniref:FAD/NAD(P)-binding domain-containing protein n=1 Tax=Piloderma croceum (strain F 1598) TaxID=765440 RepID=A0A0C3FJZ5_PILCF|nr:hypothetical protein PILCRDRAFT_822737 [Piloderma croceum F 1598]